MNKKLIVSSSPHIHKSDTIQSVMLDVIIALIPASMMGIYCFGYRAALVILTAIGAAIGAEYLYCLFMKKPQTAGDLSAVVTGLLLGLNLPATIPLWMVVVGSVFAIIIVKQFYGGLGKNFMNPALAARCFMIIAWAGAMTTFTEPFSGYGPDAVSQATPLAILKGTSEGYLPSLQNAFLGIKAGTIGETSGAMLILGGIYLLIRRVITWHIPVVYIASFAILTYIFADSAAIQTMFRNELAEPECMDTLYYTGMSVCSGGLLLGALFMATDYVTTPTTKIGQIIFALGCGILTFVIRKFGGYPEGVSFSILLMNIITPLIDRYIRPKSFGMRKGGAKS